jgi:choline kinase
MKTTDCPRCKGRGYLSAFSHVNLGLCCQCLGVGKVDRLTSEEALQEAIDRNEQGKQDILAKVEKLKVFAEARRQKFTHPDELKWVEKDLEWDLEFQRKEWRRCSDKIKGLKTLSGTKFKAADARAFEPFYLTVVPSRG